MALDGRKVPAAESEGFFVGPSIVDHVKPEMRLAQEEIFGPVLSVVRVKTSKRRSRSARLPVRQRRQHLHQQRMGGAAIQT